jgi:hypothetical protein
MNTLPLPVFLLLHGYSFLRAALREPGLFLEMSGFDVRYGASKAAGREIQLGSLFATDDAIQAMIRQHLARQKYFCNLIAMKVN